LSRKVFQNQEEQSASPACYSQNREFSGGQTILFATFAENQIVNDYKSFFATSTQLTALPQKAGTALA